MLVLIVSVFAAGMYSRGLRVLWRRAGYGRGVGRWQAGLFYVGLLTLVVALESPLEVMAQQFFAAHMVQHLLLMLVAAPLLVLGAPLLTMLWSVPSPTRQRFGALFRLARMPVVVAFALHSLVLWLWHLPRLYDAALAEVGIHAIEHISFLGTAALFWWLVLHGGRAGAGAGVLFVFGLALESTVLGALLTFARSPWYTAHLTSAAGFGLSPAEDQQLAGLIMWIPGGLVYLVSALALCARMFRSPDEAVLADSRPRGMLP